MTTASCAAVRNSYRYAEQLTRRSGSSFRLSFLLLPRSAYRAMCVLYAFMRLTDDLADDPLPEGAAVDSPDSSASRQFHLQEWRSGLQACLQNGVDSHPLHAALREVVQEYQIDPTWLDDVITGVEFDLMNCEISNYPELNRYCYLVAGTVGLCCQAIWRADLQQTRSLAITCGEAFQLTNILRDLKEDAQRNRCYLPADELQQFGYSSEMLNNHLDPKRFVPLMEFQLHRAEQCYQQAAKLEEMLQGGGRRMFRVMFTTYYTLLRQIQKDPLRSLQERVRLSRRERIGILISAPHRKLQRLF